VYKESTQINSVVLLRPSNRPGLSCHDHQCFLQLVESAVTG